MGDTNRNIESLFREKRGFEQIASLAFAKESLENHDRNGQRGRHKKHSLKLALLGTRQC
jgi:hypothetical protein